MGDIDVWILVTGTTRACDGTGTRTQCIGEIGAAIGTTSGRRGDEEGPDVQGTLEDGSPVTGTLVREVLCSKTSTLNT